MTQDTSRKWTIELIPARERSTSTFFTEDIERLQMRLASAMGVPKCMIVGTGSDCDCNCCRAMVLAKYERCMREEECGTLTEGQLKVAKAEWSRQLASMTEESDRKAKEAEERQVLIEVDID